MITTLIALPYKIARLPLTVVDRSLASRWPETSSTRVGLDRVLGSSDRFAGDLLGNRELAETRHRPPRAFGEAADRRAPRAGGRDPSRAGREERPPPAGVRPPRSASRPRTAPRPVSPRPTPPRSAPRPTPRPPPPRPPPPRRRPPTSAPPTAPPRPRSARPRPTPLRRRRRRPRPTRPRPRSTTPARARRRPTRPVPTPRGSRAADRDQEAGAQGRLTSAALVMARAEG